MGIQLEARPYGPESSQEEIAAIKSRVYWYAEGIIMYREVPVLSAFQLNLFGEKLRELASRIVDSYILIIDLTETEPPNAESRAKLRLLFAEQTKMKRAVVFTGRNFLINVAAKFVLGSVGLKSFTVHGTLTEALEATRSGI